MRISQRHLEEHGEKWNPPNKQQTVSQSSTGTAKRILGIQQHLTKELRLRQCTVAKGTRRSRLLPCDRLTQWYQMQENSLEKDSEARNAVDVVDLKEFFTRPVSMETVAATTWVAKSVVGVDGEQTHMTIHH